MYERPLDQPTQPPSMPVVYLPQAGLDVLAAIDNRAFNPTWRVGRAGLADAVAATGKSETFGVVSDEVLLGFAIVGEMSGLAYLQRLAVDPVHSRRGIGRALVREAVAWGHRLGARTMVLNTQPDNSGAADLYTSEGFVALGPRLKVLALIPSNH